MTRAEAKWRIKDHAEYHHLYEPRAVLISEALGVAIESMDIADKYEEVLGDGDKLLAVCAKADKFDQLLADVKEVIDGLSRSADDAKSRFDEANDDLDIEKYAKYGAKMQTDIEIEGVLRRVVEKYEVQ